jgi:hypothetical protein
MMKKKITVVALSALLILGLSAVNVFAGNSFNFLGETTWTVTVNERETGSVTPQVISMTGAISKLGTNYYLFQGSVQMQGDNPFIVAGGGSIVNGTLYLNLATTQKHTDNQDSGTNSYRDTGTMHVEITDLTNLSGTFYEVQHDFDRVSKTFSEGFTAGTVSCDHPFPLNPSAGAATQMLLLQ